MAIVAGLAADVGLFLLDEPTSGLDPLMEAVFRDVVREITARGGTVLLSSHILAEAEALCAEVSIIRAGRIVETRQPVPAAPPHPHDAARDDASAAGPARGLARRFGCDVSDDGRTVRLEVGADELGAVLERIAAHGVVSLTSAPPTLEELFPRHDGDTLARLNGRREPR